MANDWPVHIPKHYYHYHHHHNIMMTKWTWTTRSCCSCCGKRVSEGRDGTTSLVAGRLTGVLLKWQLHNMISIIDLCPPATNQWINSNQRFFLRHCPTLCNKNTNPSSSCIGRGIGLVADMGACQACRLNDDGHHCNIVLLSRGCHNLCSKFRISQTIINIWGAEEEEEEEELKGSCELNGRRLFAELCLLINLKQRRP